MGGKANNQEVAVPLRQNRELEIADSYLRRVVRGCVLEVVFSLTSVGNFKIRSNQSVLPGLLKHVLEAFPGKAG